MKQLTLLAIFLILRSVTFPQPFLKFAATNKGLECSIGAISGDGGFESTLSYKFSMTRVDKPQIVSITIGKQILLTHEEEDNYSITPVVGYGYLRWKDFSLYDAAIPSNTGSAAGGPLPEVYNEGIMSMREGRPVFGLELGKDSYMGRVGLTANWCKDFYFGVNLRIFPYRIRN